MIIFSIQLVNKFAQKESKRKAVGSTKVASIEYFIEVTDSSYDIELCKSPAMSDLVLNTFDKPTSPSRICSSKVAFINIDNSEAFANSFDKFRSSELPLKLCSWKVLVSIYLFNLPIRNVELRSQKFC